MRNVSYLQGIKELKEIKKYAADSLNNKEKLFVQMIDKKVKSYIKKESPNFLTLGEIVDLKTIWKKYRHLEPFIFLSDPEKEMPEVFQNQIAFIIFTVWKSSHLRGDEDLESAAIEAANVLLKSHPPYSPEIKEKASKTFWLVMSNTGYPCLDDLSFSFWEKKIFPYLEGEWEFKWKSRF